MPAAKFALLLIASSGVGCAHENTEFDRLLSVVDQRDQCIQRITADIGSVFEVQPLSMKSIINSMVDATSGELKVGLAHAAASAYGDLGRDFDSAKFEAGVRLRLSEVSLYGIENCGAAAVEVLPNVLFRKLSVPGGLAVCHESEIVESREIERLVFLGVSLESAKIDWEPTWICPQRLQSSKK